MTSEDRANRMKEPHDHASAAGAPGASGPGDPGYEGETGVGDEGALEPEPQPPSGGHSASS